MSEPPSNAKSNFAVPFPPFLEHGGKIVKYKIPPQERRVFILHI
jgi:hypothetical protein